MEKITVQKKNSHTSWGGFRFRRDRILAGGIISLRCVKRNCRGRLRVDEKDNVVFSSEHTHEPESGGLKVVSEIRRKSVERQIFPQNSDTLSAYSTSDRLEKKMILIEPRQMNDYMERTPHNRNIWSTATERHTIETYGRHAWPILLSVLVISFIPLLTSKHIFL